ncbi:hypothetical protein [Stenotrophomonas sp. PS02297]|uniref:hypothetical protein n=1 Tax=Stenotrophomonas sp. PS02297 TaxID=2991423 RepID=UPI002499C586|nr:hypothetical protein [Stenotrophomonas sp. PS02297]
MNRAPANDHSDSATVNEALRFAPHDDPRSSACELPAGGDFPAEAGRRHAGISTSGKTIPWGEMRGYLEHRMKGHAPASSGSQASEAAQHAEAALEHGSQLPDQQEVTG